MDIIKSYTYDDIGLIPVVGTEENSSRTQINTKRVFFEDIELEVPLIAAPMDTVANNSLFVTEVAKYGGLALFNRYMNDKILYQEIEKTLAVTKNFGVAIGLNELAKLKQILELGVKVICIDIANGYSVKLTRHLNSKEFKNLQDKYSFYLMTGNVATAEGFNNLAQEVPKLNGVRVGIGGGAVCTTSLVTGVGVGIATSLIDIYENDNTKHTVDIIADGSCKNFGDITKALSLGADYVMSGYLFAKTKEANNNGNYRGMASKGIQEENEQYYSDIQKRTYVEGENVKINSEYSVADLMLSVKNALHSAGTYLNCPDIHSLKHRVKKVAILSTNTVNEKHVVKS